MLSNKPTSMARLSIQVNICIKIIFIFRVEILSKNNKSCSVTGTLTTIIGLFVLYMEPIMMTTDMIATLINQQHLARCFQRLQQVDDELAKENVQIDYRSLKRLSLILIIVTLCRKVLMILFGYFVFDLNIFQLWSMYVPICVSVLSKIYFVLIMCITQKKFDAINKYLDELANSLLNENDFRNQHSHEGTDGVDNNNQKNKSRTTQSNSRSALQTGYLKKEIVVESKPKFFRIMNRPALNLVKPFESQELTSNTEFRRSDQLNNSTRFPINEFPLVRNEPIVVGDRFDKRLTNLCFLHDEICEIVGITNYMFSFQMLMLMAYGFLGITAQLYFVYCGLADQVNIFLRFFVLHFKQWFRLIHIHRIFLTCSVRLKILASHRCLSYQQQSFVSMLFMCVGKQRIQRRTLAYFCTSWPISLMKIIFTKR